MGLLVKESKNYSSLKITLLNSKEYDRAGITANARLGGSRESAI